MRALFIPYFPKNPYQNLLAAALGKQGVKVDFTNDFKLISILKTVMGSARPDIFHFHWTYPYVLAKTKYKSVLLSNLFILKLLLLKILGLKVIWTVHNTINHEQRFVSIDLFYRKILARLCNKIIVHGELAKSEVKRLYKLSKTNQISVIPHGNYIEVYENKMNKNRARRKLDIDAKSKVLLYFGYIRQYKGIPDLLNVFKILRTSNVALLIVGNPKNNEIVKYLKKECQNIKNIKLYLEYVPDDEIQIYMNAADFVVLPFKDILTSGSMMLAISFGKSVIAPDIGHIREVLDKKGNIVYNPKKKDALLKAVQACLKLDGNKLEGMSKHNFKVARKYNWDGIGKQTFMAYQEA
jgi:glycosyltransferase involved in cell wall biosynthesis